MRPSLYSVFDLNLYITHTIHRPPYTRDFILCASVVTLLQISSLIAKTYIHTYCKIEIHGYMPNTCPYSIPIRMFIITVLSFNSHRSTYQFECSVPTLCRKMFTFNTYGMKVSLCEDTEEDRHYEKRGLLEAPDKNVIIANALLQRLEKHILLVGTR